MVRQNLTLSLHFVCLPQVNSLLNFVWTYISDSYPIGGIGHIIGLDQPLPGGCAATKNWQSLITLSHGPDGRNVTNTLSLDEAIEGLLGDCPCRGILICRLRTIEMFPSTMKVGG